MRAAVFIDAGYLTKVLEHQFDRRKIAFLAFSEEIVGDFDRLRTYYYTCMPHQSDPPTMEERKRYSSAHRFLHAIERLPRFEVRLGKLRRSGNDFVQKRVDIMLAVDLVRMSWANQISNAVIVTGDSDFVPAIQAAKDAGVLVQLYYHPSSVHNELLSTVDESFEITTSLIEKVIMDP